RPAAPHCPVARVGVFHPVHRGAGVVDEADRFAAVGELPRPVADDVGDGRILGAELVQVRRDDEVAAGIDAGGGEGIGDALVEIPAGDVGGGVAAVVQLDEFFAWVAGRGMVHQ